VTEKRREGGGRLTGRQKSEKKSARVHENREKSVLYRNLFFSRCKKKERSSFVAEAGEPGHLAKVFSQGTLFPILFWSVCLTGEGAVLREEVRDRRRRGEKKRQELVLKKPSRTVPRSTWEKKGGHVAKGNRVHKKTEGGGSFQRSHKGEDDRCPGKRGSTATGYIGEVEKEKPNGSFSLE